MDYKLLADVAALTGEIMLMSGAETYRVEDTISRILKTANLKRVEAFVTGTGFVLTLDDPKINAITLVRRVKERNNNMNKIYLANNVSRMLCAGDITVEESFQELKKIRNVNQYNNWIVNLCIVFTATFFSVLYGANIWECLCASVAGLVIVCFTTIGNKLNYSKVISNIVITFFIALLAAFFESKLTGFITKESIIAGGIMPLVPGLAITNAIRDTLQGDYISGGARAMEAFVLAISIGVGAGVGLSVYSLLGGVF